MILTLAISGYRSLRDLVIPLAPLTVITGANGSGKSSLYRALRLLAGVGLGGAVASIAREGGLPSVLWAGPEKISRRMRSGEVPVQGTAPTGDARRVRLGFATDEAGYTVEFGLPPQGPLDPSAFKLDPEIKREVIFGAPLLRPASTLLDRKGPLVRVRDLDGAWEDLIHDFPMSDSVLSELVDPRQSPEVHHMRDLVRTWRFYDQFRTDVDAPARMRHIGTRTPVLANDGADLAAALQTIAEIGEREALVEAIADGLAGSRIEIDTGGPRFGVLLRQPGMLRPLDASELSDGTLRYLLWVAALLTPRPPPLMVLNEPETSLHPDLLPALGRLITRAAKRSQVLVVSHARTLIESLTGTDRTHIELVKDLGETRVAGMDFGDAPAWAWAKG